MRPSPEEHRITLRHLAAARFYLPVELEQGEFPNTELQYVEFLHQAEFELALDLLECLGALNRGHAEEGLFWSELALAAGSMELQEKAERYGDNARQAR